MTESKQLQMAEIQFDILAKLAKKIEIPLDNDDTFLPYTEQELQDAAEAFEIIARIENNHCKLDT